MCSICKTPAWVYLAVGCMTLHGSRRAAFPSLDKQFMPWRAYQRHVNERSPRVLL